jgi:hypothetical protein
MGLFTLYMFVAMGMFIGCIAYRQYDYATSTTYLHNLLEWKVASLRTDFHNLRAALANGTYATHKVVEPRTGGEARGNCGKEEWW